jgi:hypothetical protein
MIGSVLPEETFSVVIGTARGTVTHATDLRMNKKKQIFFSDDSCLWNKLLTMLQSLDDLVPISEQLISLLVIIRRRAKEGAAAAM